MSKILGIDLGTTNSVVAVYHDGAPRILSPSQNCNVVPSIVALDPEGDWVVGEDARGQQVLNPHHTVYSIKRFMGRRHNEVESEEKLVPYPVTGKPEEFVQVRVGKKRYTPQQISSMLLRSIKQMAEEQFGEPVERAIVTVPAYFNDSQRQATKDAAEIAGLKVERMINEPTAAAMAYGVDRRGSRNVVVFDFGGGTFDLSAMTIGSGDFKVLAVQGNTHLGGDDFDQRIIDVVAEDFLRRERIDLRDDPMALQRLKQASQHAKAQLSTMLETRIMLPFICMDEKGPKHLDYELTRELFEAVCQDLFDECYDCCRKLLADAGIYASNVDDVVMVGGTTRMPKVQEVAKKAFETDELDRSINPDEVVALGAAILGGVMQGDLRNINLMDVTSHSFGVEAADGRVAVLVPKDTPIPTSIKKVFSTPRDNQTSVPINVLEGDGRLACENRSLGTFRLTGIRRLPRGVPQIEVEFKIDANGILSVLATDKDTGRSQKVVVSGTAGLDAVEIEEAREETERGVTSAARRNEVAMVKHRAESTLHDTREWLKIHAQMLPARTIDQIESALRGLEKRITKGDTNGMATHLRKLRDVMSPHRQAG